MLKKYLKSGVKAMVRKAGFDIVKIDKEESEYPKDIALEKEFLVIYEKCQPYSATSIESIYSLNKAVEYVVKNNILGDMVECGVASGGSSMVMAHSLLQLGDKSRKIYMYDTYAGMPEPGEYDVRYNDKPAHEQWARRQKGDINTWCYGSLEDVKARMQSTGYPMNQIVFIKGDVADTIPKTVPEKISILRLDTDWYESTRHDLEHLFPLLSKNGILFIDDYGHWKGCRKAVDDYFRENNIHMLLDRVDYTRRIGIKL